MTPPLPIPEPGGHGPLPELSRLLAILAALRAPGGCPWDREQTPQTMAPHLLEEVYECLEALETGGPDAVREELGDVLMNAFMIAQMHAEARAFDVEEVAAGIADKLVRRHPHVFGDQHADDPVQVLEHWERIKKEERGEQGEGPRSVLAGVPAAMPALLKAWRTGQKAARVGFDWPDRKGPRAKVDEELRELDEAIAEGRSERIEEELGDTLLALVNLARHLDIDPEGALRRTVERFARRFRKVEAELGPALQDAGIEELEAAWQRAKAVSGE